MELRRTANAGVLLKLDGVTILLDGVCREVKPYPATPPEERDAITACFPDVVCFTHAHKDHYDPTFAALYEKRTGGVIFGPETLPGCKASMNSGNIGGVEIIPIVTRHIGWVGNKIDHASFIIRGSKTIWFAGDASPLQLKRRPDLPHPDLLLVPYAFANTPSSWEYTKSLQADHVVLLHMPERETDDIGLWDAVDAVTAGDNLLIPKMRQTLSL